MNLLQILLNGTITHGEGDGIHDPSWRWADDQFLFAQLATFNHYDIISKDFRDARRDMFDIYVTMIYDNLYDICG